MTKHPEVKSPPAQPAPAPLLEPSLSNWRLPRPGQLPPTWRLSK